MLSSYANGFAAGAVVVTLLGFGAIRRERHLEGKLGQLRYTLALLGIAAFGVVGAMFGMDSVPLPSLDAAQEGKMDMRFLMAIRDQCAASRELLLYLFGILGMALLLVAYGFAALRPFVLEHRLELAARDQARGADVLNN